MRKLYLCIFIAVFFTGVLHAEDTPYMKLIDSHKGIDKMIVCLPMIQKTTDNYKKAIQISIKEDSIDVQDYLNKKDNPPDTFKSFHGLMKGYYDGVLFRMVGEWYIIVNMPKDEEAKKKYQKNHIVNKAIGLSHDISYTQYEPYLKECSKEFIQLKKENKIIKEFVNILKEKAEEEIYGSIGKTQIVEDKEEQPKYFYCDNKYKTDFYLKFHITDKTKFNFATEKIDLKGQQKKVSTLEMHEDKSFQTINYDKFLTLFESDKYYYFSRYEPGYFWGGDMGDTVDIIINRYNLKALLIEHRKVMLHPNRKDKINDKKIDEYFNDEKTRLFEIRQCEEIDIKQKI